MENKLLYITIMETQRTGGSLCRKNNRIALSKSGKFSIIDYYIDLKQTKLGKAISTLFGYKAGLDKQHIKKIVELINKDKISFVFIDTSLYGKLVYQINKKTTAKIFTFFHNCEYEIYRQEYKNTLKRIPILQSVKINEYLSLKYSRKCIFLTQRDCITCGNIYNFFPDSYFITPIALQNTYIRQKNSLHISRQKPKTLLFVGSYFYPNIRGVAWFINEVLPFINYKLILVGKGFETQTFKEMLNNLSNIDFKGFVDNLDLEYEEADIVVQPVFEGSGMKTKTAECLMYGKPLISTSEGLEGYDIANIKTVFRCDTKEDFISLLKRLENTELPVFSVEENKCFEELYSIEARTIAYKNKIN